MLSAGDIKAVLVLYLDLLLDKIGLSVKLGSMVIESFSRTREDSVKALISMSFYFLFSAFLYILTIFEIILPFSKSLCVD